MIAGHGPLKRALRVSLGVLLLAAGAVQAAEVTLRNEVWSITVDPATLAVKGTPGGTISAGQEKLGPVDQLKTGPTSAEWVYSDKAVHVTTRLEGETFVVHVAAEREGTFTWPVLPAETERTAYILPCFEGLYVPADDAEWAAYLAEHGPMDTTADLSMPFYGVQSAGHTLTYLLPNPFGNELVFRNESGRIGATFTHAFRPNWKVKEYEVRVSLGSASPIEPARRYRQYLIDQHQFVSLKEKIARTPEAAKLLGAAHVYLWGGDGVSAKMIRRLQDAGLDHLRIVVSDSSSLRNNPGAVTAARDAGYLIGPYDSYDSVHRPGQEDSWETAQFDQHLYDTGAILKQDGTPKKGFQQKGYMLSPLAARPYVEKRVGTWMKDFSANIWFMDCDAFGQWYDDFSPLHPATQSDDLQARVSRMDWIRDTYHCVMGSEGGSSLAAGSLHFAEGLETPVVGWGDADLQKDKSSPYYLGAYWPPDGPAVFFKPVPVKPAYKKFFFDPRYRLPLYQVAMHDALIATHHWTFASFKLKDLVGTREMLELLYGVPPLYHLNPGEFEKRKKEILKHYAFFSPLHRETAQLPMTEFEYLTPDRLVQRTRFGNAAEMVANFSEKAYEAGGKTVPARSVMYVHLQTGKATIYQPTP